MLRTQDTHSPPQASGPKDPPGAEAKPTPPQATGPLDAATARRAQPEVPHTLGASEVTLYKHWAEHVDREILDMRYDSKAVKNSIKELRATMERVLAAVSGLQNSPKQDP